MPPKLSRQNSAAAMARKGAAAAAAAAPAASANGYKLPDPIPAGEILRSSNDSQGCWRGVEGEFGWYSSSLLQ